MAVFMSPFTRVRVQEEVTAAIAVLVDDGNVFRLFFEDYFLTYLEINVNVFFGGLQWLTDETIGLFIERTKGVNPTLLCQMLGKAV